MAKKGILTVFLSLLIIASSSGQKSLDRTMIYPPGSGIFKNYSIYQPKGFNPNAVNKLMIGFHPYNPGTWNANSWRDTLKSFVEMVNVLLICPDGGPDGRIDDAVDYDFAKFLMDSAVSQYNVDPEKIFLIGFSVGGKAVYEFGLDRDKEIKGMIPIGAAIDGVDFSDVIHKAKCNSFYLVHGGKDNPNARYYPMKDDLEKNEGLVDAILMANIGHTINFPNRNAILKIAFDFVDNEACDVTGMDQVEVEKIRVSPTIARQGQAIKMVNSKESTSKIHVYDALGRQVQGSGFQVGPRQQIEINTSGWSAGMHIIVVDHSSEKDVFKIMITD